MGICGCSDRAESNRGRRGIVRRILPVLATVIALVVVLVASRSQTDETEQGATAVAIKPTRALGAIQPRLSPDGERIVVSYQGAIWTLPRSGGTMTRLTDGPGFDVAPVWSPDGKRIAYVNTRSMYAGPLRIINVESRTPVKLPSAVNVAGTIAYQKLEFHPDGERILGVFRAEGQDRGLSWYNTKSGKITPVATLERWSRYALSNDGKTVVFTRTMNVVGQQGGNNGQEADLFAVPSDGGKPKKLARFPARIHDLCFAADNRSLIVATELGGVHYDLWSLALSDPVRSKRKMTHGQADEHQPTVSRDGRWLVYADNRDNTTTLMVRDLRSGEDKPITILKFDFCKPAGQLKLAIQGKDGKPLTARVSIERRDGKFFAPPRSLHRLLKTYGHFYCDGKTDFALPAGEYQVKVFRGPEYEVAYRNVEITAGQTASLDVALSRWIHNAKRGWYSGENHIHANYGYGEWYNTPETMLQQCAGEDLNVCNFMVANSDSNGTFDREFFRGRPDVNSTPETILYWNQEFRSTIWGHMTLVNLSQVVEPVYTGFQGTTNPWDIPTNSDIADKTHLQNGLVNYTHVAQNPDDPYKNPYTGKSIPIDAALGKIDSLDLNGSYAGTVPLWYRLLNCGFKLSASAGTDCFLNRIRSRVPGGDRVYVKIDGRFTYKKWIAGLRAGRTFVTNGPMLEFSAGGKQIGETVRLSSPGKLEITGQAASRHAMNRVEVIYNGKVIATVPLSKDGRKATLRTTVDIPTSGWIALRATGPGHEDLPLFSQNAHTSPIYIEVKDRPFDARQDAAYFLKWIDRIALAVRVRDRIPSEKLKKHVRDQLESAREVYRKLATR